ncbi:Mov34/MPN/PAD-1 family protein [Stakelama sp. CBK3Z-3]|uniref:Mov34/MPN/PAD-1 family protein n=1 Tax=Stakelama flava TaxID=2860338 RepID=A0ABS6XH17_9SPHN|nr:Mov34/MPN/PAD-1 family protein [Stakelama flava]MBW4329498.1 Mov34/MPN/PAD-1 family protein [Stakelama flava]
MNPRISRATLTRLMVLAGQSPDAEICGILRGHGDAVRAALATANAAADPARRFEIDPAMLLRCHRLARRPGGFEIIGYYHSHPGGRPFPSATDAAMAQPDGKLWLIVTRDEARLWRAVAQGDMHGRFDAVAFDMPTGNRIDTSLAAVLRSGREDSWSVELEYFRD